MAERHGSETTVPDWQSRLVCGQCGGRRVDMVATGTERRLTSGQTLTFGPQSGGRFRVESGLTNASSG